MVMLAYALVAATPMVHATVEVTSPAQMSAPADVPPAGAIPDTPPAAASDTPPPAAPEATPEPAAAAGDVSDDAAPRDPWEHTNRSMFAFNDHVDRYFMAPVTHGYMAVVPRFVRQRLTNVVANLDEPMVAINDLLQGQFDRFGKATVRFAVNSTFGLGGMFDIAASRDLPRHDSDFGQTLGKWGVKPGAYVVLPLFGPSNVRDASGKLVDIVAEPVGWVFGTVLTTFGQARWGGEFLTTREGADPALRALHDATDPYATARSASIQARAAKVRATTGKAETLPDFDTP